MSKTFLVSLKRTKWERDLLKYGSVKELKRIYRLQNQIFQRVYSSHVRQKKSQEKLMKTFNHDATFIYREELSIPFVKNFSFLISFGGDNHFIYTARFASQPIIGINSDPKTSTGALLYFHVDKFIEHYKKKKFYENQYLIEEWTLIEGIIEYPDGSKISTGKCISETIIRNEFAEAMSRYLIRINQKEYEEQKSSGLLLSTGAGSTGWFYNCLPHSIQLYEDATFPKNAEYFKIIAREPGFNRTHKFKYLYCTLHKDDVLEIISEMDGVIVVDSHPECSFSFPPGSKAKFFLSKEKLKVIKPYKNQNL
ncbi:MAG: NAD+ kinase [Leptospiraceae bacterium]|nr:NAD+ kinase [Leptospiraceae bacterium]MDW7976680.1 NAD+ kinase [Leptospiraceae bacterium]